MSQTFELVYTERAARDIRSLDFVVKKRLAAKMCELKVDPLGTAQKLVNSKLGHYRWRVGDCRIVFDHHGLRIVVLRVGHRREICR